MRIEVRNGVENDVGWREVKEKEGNKGKCGRSGWEFVSSRQEGMRKAHSGLQVSRNQNVLRAEGFIMRDH